MIRKVKGEISIKLKDQDHEVIADFAFCEGRGWRGGRVDPGLGMSVSHI